MKFARLKKVLVNGTSALHAENAFFSNFKLQILPRGNVKQTFPRTRKSVSQ